MDDYLKSGEISEQSIQKAVIDWVKFHPFLKNIVLHIPNEGKRTARYGKSLKDMGMKAGVSDLFIATGKHNFFGAWIEIKSARGKLSEFQKVFMEDMRQQNYFTAVCYSVDECIDLIKWYCFKD